jgi:hypothetical protein
MNDVTRRLSQGVSCFCYPISVIAAIIVVTIMLATCLPLEADDHGIGTFDYQWRMGRSCRLVGILWLGGANSDMMDLITKLSKSQWVFRESVSVYGGSPNKQPSCSMPGLNPVRRWDIKASLGQSLGADYRSGLFRQQRECVSVWEFRRPNLTVGQNYSTRYWCVAAVVPINSNLVSNPLSGRIIVPDSEREVGKIQNCAFSRTGGIASRLRNLIQSPSKNSEYTSEDSRPYGRSAASKEEIEYGSHLWIFFLFASAVLAFIATVGSLMYAFERSAPIYLLAALVCGYVWYLSVSAIKV